MKLTGFDCDCATRLDCYDGLICHWSFAAAFDKAFRYWDWRVFVIADWFLGTVASRTAKRCGRRCARMGACVPPSSCAWFRCGGWISESERGLYVGRWRVFLFSSAIARHHVGGGVAMWFPPLPRPRHHLNPTSAR